jgi:hypothetical protein
MAFSEEVTNKRFVGKLETHNVETVSELFALADKGARESEAHARVERRGAPEDPPEGETPRLGAKKNKRKAAAVLAAEGHPKPQAGGKTAGEGTDGGKWCELHRTNYHDLTECRLVKDLAAERRKDRDNRRRDDHDSRGPPSPDGAGLGFQELQHAVATIFGGAGAPSSR